MYKELREPYIKKLNIKKKITSFKDLEIQTKQISDGFEEYLADKARYSLWLYIKKHVYKDDELTANGHNNSTYERTFQFLNAVTMTKTRDGYKVGIDSRMMTAIPREVNMTPFGQHAYNDGRSAVNDMAQMIDEGSASGKESAGFYEYEGIHFMDYLNDWVDKNAVRLWNVYKRSQGLK